MKSQKLSTVIYVVSLILFAVGAAIAGSCLGRLSLRAFMGYVMCISGILACICNTAVLIVNHGNSGRR